MKIPLSSLRFLDQVLAVLDAVVNLVVELVGPGHAARGEVYADLAGGRDGDCASGVIQPLGHTLALSLRRILSRLT